jgi:parallel beta helix pectate lyase-like protein
MFVIKLKNISVYFFILSLLLLFPLHNLFSYDSHNIALLKSGRINYALAEWWLNDEKNNGAEALQTALLSGAEFVTVSDKGSSWITEPLFLESNQTVFFDKGVVIEANRDSFYGKGDSLFSAEGKENISLIGYGAVLRMYRADYTFPPYKVGQWRHVVSLKSCSNIEIKGLSLQDSGGDGIYVGVSNKSEVKYCSNITAEDLHITGNYRQGISVISAENLVINNCIIENTGTHLPAAGIDFEPNSSDERISNCIIKDSVFRNNFGPGILLFLASLKKESHAVSVKIINCKSYINRRPISIRKIADGKQGEIILENNFFIGFKGIDRSTTAFQVIKK